MKILILILCVSLFLIFNVQAEELTLDKSIASTEVIVKYDIPSYEIDIKAKRITIFYSSYNKENKLIASSVLAVEGADYDMVMATIATHALGAELQTTVYNCLKDKLKVTGVLN